MKKIPKLVIIPGIGDDTNIYYAFAKAWKRLGYETHVIPFKWVHTTVPYEPSMAAFMRKLDKIGYDAPVYLIGISAGGTAAVNALALRPEIKKVVTIASPLMTMTGLRNPLLAASISQVEANLAAFSSQQKQRILSLYGVYDQVVQTRLSRPEGVRTKRIFGFIHAPVIFIAMTLRRRSLHAFFHKNKPSE